ncbi:uncharacterized protein LOC135210125 [Macrobrachium nipponense]|uniref:uncharacterized protein LOC135210125 n=1 Tax=Macrobrachium nipponense TaxID=159736 RepID=UPI0030C8BF76
MIKMKAFISAIVSGLLFSFWGQFSEASRQKRYLFINPEAPITLGFLLNMPVSLALPTLAPVNGRSFNSQSSSNSNSYSDAEYDEEVPQSLYWDPAYEQQLEKLSVYFSHLELHYVGCQERLLCELASEPEIYSPIGEIFMKELRQMHGPVKPSRDSLMWRYMLAAREGFTNPIEDCEKAYPKCPIPASKILNMPVLKVWQYIASKLNLQLV